MQLRVNITDHATPALRALIARLTPLQVNRVSAAGVRVTVRDHLQAKNALPNKRGWKKTNFYARARRTVTSRADTTRGVVEIALEGMRQRRFGGIIRPVNAKTIAIPALEIAYGRRAREFSNLQFRPINRGRLVGMLYRKAEGRQIPVFWLLKYVTQVEDPTVLPTDDEMRAGAVKALEEFVDPALR